MTTLPSITPKQQTILHLLYKFRFLQRSHIQALLNHKDKRRISSWLKDLRDKGYIDWKYDNTNFITKAQPASYYFALNGVRYVRSLNEYPNDALRKRYKEPTRSQAFIDRCLLVADCCIALKANTTTKVRYVYKTPAEFADLPEPYDELNELQPHLYFTKQEGNATTHYLLEVVDASLPRYQVRKRMKDYIEYLDDTDWNNYEESQPVLLIVCASTADLLYIKRRMRTLQEDRWEDEGLPIRLTTTAALKQSDITTKIWEEV